MSAEVLHVEKRDLRGKRNAKRLRVAGRIPAVLYGHGEETMSLALVAEDLETALRHGAHLVELQGLVQESALLREIQWDPFGAQVLHVDLTRVKAGESVTVNMAVELRGDAPGVRHGGSLEHTVHEVEISCPATKIPEKLQLNINSLEVGQSLTVADIELPEGATLMADPEAIVVQCVETAEPLVDEVAAPSEAEPEVIGRKAEDEEEAS